MRKNDGMSDSKRNPENEILVSTTPDAALPETESTTGYRFAGHLLLPAERRLLAGEQEIELEAKVLDLILLLVEHRQRTLDKREIVDALWGHRPVTDTALSQLLHKARRALAESGDAQTMIRTVYGRGLQWVVPTECVFSELTTPSAPAMVGATASAPAETPMPPRRFQQRHLWIFATLIVVATIAGFIAILMQAATPILPRLALLPVENATGDPRLDWVRSGLPGLIGGLIGEAGGINVVDALETARAAEYVSLRGQSEVDRLRYVTGAGVVVTGRLRRLNGDLYELSLRVHDENGATDIVVNAAQVATLGIDTVPRIQRMLKRPISIPASNEGGLRGDDYLAQTFARGLDLAAHGQWEQAKPYFALCVQNAPRFLPGRLRLGEAQARTRDFAPSNATFQALVTDAQAREQPAMEAAALIGLAENEFRRGDRRTALDLLQRARPLAERGGDPDAQARLALLEAQAQAILERPALAIESLQRGKTLIERYGLHQREPLLHHTEEQMAEMRRDFPAQEAAALAALAAAEAIGDEREAINETYRLGRMLSWQERPFDAIPLLLQGYRRARDKQMLDIEVVSGVELVWVLVETGLNPQACQIANSLVADLDGSPNNYWKAIGFAARARCQRHSGDAAAAITSYHAAWPLIDLREDPQLASLILHNEALAAFVAEPEALTAILARFDAVTKTHDAKVHRHNRRLVAALEAAYRGDTEAVKAELEQELADPNPDDIERNDLRRTAWRIALVTNDPAFAAIALDGYQPEATNDTEILRLYEQWSATHADRQSQQIAETRLSELQRRAIAAIAGQDFGTLAQ
jgi:DNA-binding winged helix-turn-helix (wHTH) protein